jgi:hypothetical protein
MQLIYPRLAPIVINRFDLSVDLKPISSPWAQKALVRGENLSPFRL